MEMRLALLQTQSQEKDNYGTLGSLVDTMCAFLRSGKKQDAEIYDSVSLNMVPVKDYFTETDNRFVVNQNRLPFDVDIKGAYISKQGNLADKPCVELSEINFNLLGELISSDPLREKIKLDGRSIFSHRGKKLLQTQIATRYGPLTNVKRTIVTLQPKFDSLYSVDLALKSLDLIYDNNSFIRDPELQRKLDVINASMPVSVRGTKLEMRLVPEMKALIELEQKLMMKHVPVPYMATQAKLLQTPACDLSAKLQKQLEKEAVARIMAIKPGLTYGEALILVRKIGSKLLDNK